MFVIKINIPGIKGFQPIGPLTKFFYSLFCDISRIKDKRLKWILKIK